MNCISEILACVSVFRILFWNFSFLVLIILFSTLGSLYGAGIINRRGNKLVRKTFCICMNWNCKWSTFHLTACELIYFLFRSSLYILLYNIQCSPLNEEIQSSSRCRSWWRKKRKRRERTNRLSHNTRIMFMN